MAFIYTLICVFMVGLTTDNIVTIIVVMVGYLAGGILAYINLNIKITEIFKDFMALRNEYNEHRELNKESFVEIKQYLKDDRMKNDRDHEQIMNNISKLSDSLANFKIEVVSKIKKTGK